MTPVVFERYHLAPCGINCSSVLSVHQDNCLKCGKKYSAPQFLEINC